MRCALHVMRCALHVMRCAVHRQWWIQELGGGAPARVWQGVGRSSRRGRPGRVREGGTPPAQLGGVGELTALPQKPTLFA